MGKLLKNDLILTNLGVFLGGAVFVGFFLLVAVGGRFVDSQAECSIDDFCISTTGIVLGVLTFLAPFFVGVFAGVGSHLTLRAGKHQRAGLTAVVTGVLVIPTL